jgi:SAM-dependent methyltransferase
MSLADVYDAENTWGEDDDLFLAIAARRPGGRVLDVGCGTGRLTIALADAGHTVTGVDPDVERLEAARRKNDRVTWIEGTAGRVAAASFDVALMTSHVAQVFVTDDGWTEVLGDIARALVPGGLLAFDTRDPAARGWETWTKEATRASYDLPGGRRVESWVDVTSVIDDVVAFDWVNVFDDGSVLEGNDSLRFRSDEELRASLVAAGFVVEEVQTRPGELYVIGRVAAAG